MEVSVIFNVTDEQRKAIYWEKTKEDGLADEEHVKQFMHRWGMVGLSELLTYYQFYQRNK